MSLRILVTGDIHIGKRSSAVTHEDPVLATKNTWDKIVDYCMNNEIDILALTGDIVDRDNQFFEARGPLQRGFSRLAEINVEVYMVSGNHDYEVFAEIMDSMDYPNIHFLGRGQMWERKRFEKNGESVEFIGWSFNSRYIKTDPLLSCNIIERALDIPVIGLLHGDVDMPDSHYAPLARSNFAHKNVDVWLLGHIHKPDVINPDNPLVIYPGSPHALSPKEKDEHGITVITIDGKDNISMERVDLSPIRYLLLEINITDVDLETIKGTVAQAIEKDSRQYNSPYLKYLVYDLLMSGEHGNIKEVQNKLQNIQDLDFQENDLNVSVRKVHYDLRAKISNLEELAQQISPVGVIADALLSIEKGKANSFVYELEKQLSEKYEKLTLNNTYRLLHKNQMDRGEKETFIKDTIIEQCNLLLSELLEQKENG